MTSQQGMRVLIVEDEVLVAMDLEGLLSGMGHEVVASIAQVDAATRFADQTNIDFAILDVNLGGANTFPVADILRRREIPFLFATGYGSDGLSDAFRDEVTLQKPYDPRELERAIAEARGRLKPTSTPPLPA